jgi:HAD superfamily hydrolase (TIGR01450 family)
MIEESSEPASVQPGQLLDRSFVIDLDGTLVRDQTPLAGADELIRLVDGRYVIVSSNSTHSASDLADKLASRGLQIPADRLVLAGSMAVRLVARDYDGARILLIGSPSIRREAEKIGLHLVAGGADVVLLGRDVAFTYDKLALVVNEIRRGAILVAANPDTSHPGANGAVVPETGALMQAIISCTRPGVVRVIGKPQPDLLREALRRLGTPPQCSVVIGDNPETDAAGAVGLGMPYLLIGPDSGCDARDLNDLVERLVMDRDCLTAFSRHRGQSLRR